MKGQVLDFSVQSNSGVISGDDGNRYTFVGPEWKEHRIPARGMVVDFEVTEGGSEARGVYIAIGTAGTPNSPGLAAGQKDKIVAGVLAILLGGLGIHKFYLGYTTQGILLLVATIVGAILAILIVGIFILLAVWAVCLAEGIVYLTKSDEEFQSIYVSGRKPWF